MRVDTASATVDVSSGERTDVVVNVVNTSEVIDGVTARVIGLPAGVVTAEPALLPLFPESSGEMRLSFDLPATFAAGHHPVTVEVVSHGAQAPAQFLDLVVDVAPHAAFRSSATPRIVTARGRRRGRFVVEVRNTGNVAIEATLAASDVDRAATVSVTPERVVVGPSTTAAVIVTVRGPRLLFGADVERAVTLTVTAQCVSLPGADPDLAVEMLPPQAVGLRLRQRPRIGRGLLTALILASIVALWAAAVLFGLDRVFAGDPQTKVAPASFFAASGTAGAGGGATAATPAGALPKNGSVPAGVGGSHSGVVTATSTTLPVGRILVQAVRITPTGPKVVSSAATQSDGTFSIAGLFPTTYLVEVSATGYEPVWFPRAADAGTARPVRVSAQGDTEGIDVVVAGNPATVSGTVDVGETASPVAVTVTARALQGGGTPLPPVTTTTDATGAYVLANLAAPASYELSFTAAGYQPTTIVDQVAGGQRRIEPTVTLAVTAGSITGTVTDGSAPLGGATVTAVVAGQSRSVTTPTSGAVGSFALTGLPTPQTYVLTVTKAGYGSSTEVVDLGGGASRAGVTLRLVAGTGSVSGTVQGRQTSGSPVVPLGGATVTVGGTASSGSTAVAPSTTTLTTGGSVGMFTISGLAVPGSYTLTFSAPGYSSTTLPLTLGEDAAPADVTATLTRAFGSVGGKATLPPDGQLLTVTVSSGATSVSTTTDAHGGYAVGDLPPGVYSVTASTAQGRSATALVTVVAGEQVPVPDLTPVPT